MTRKRIDISLDTKLIENAKKIAKQENRTFSNYIETLLLKDIESRKNKDEFI